MNIAFMHIAIQQGVDKINSLQADQLIPQEIDVELNKSQMRFINTKYGQNNKYREGFEQSQKRIDDLRSLVVEYEGNVSFKEQLSSKIWVDSLPLPLDYMYLVNQYSKVWINDCKTLAWTLINPIGSQKYFTLGLSTFVCNNNTEIVDTIVLDADVTDPTSIKAPLWTNNSNFVFPQDISNVKTDILTNPGPGFSIFWETYGSLNFPGEFIVIVDANILPWAVIDASIGTLSTMVADANGSTVQTKTGQESSNIFGDRRKPTTFSQLDLAINRYSQHDDIFKLLEDPFNTTKHTSPLTTIRQSAIDIYTSGIFIIDTVKLTYIRKPREISLSLGIGCELPEHTHQEIVDMAVSSILEGISDPRFKTHQIEVGKNE